MIQETQLHLDFKDTKQLCLVFGNNFVIKRKSNIQVIKKAKTDKRKSREELLHRLTNIFESEGEYNF